MLVGKSNLLQSTLMRPTGPHGGVANSAAYTNFVARTSGLDAGHLAAYAALLNGLTTDGFFDVSGTTLKLDILYIWATADQTTALLNLCQNLYNGSTTGTVSFAADVGYTGDGSTFFIDTGFNPNTASSPLYVLNSASMGVYVRTNTTSGGANGYNVGADNVGAANFTSFFFGNENFKMNGPNRAAASATSQGQWIATRTASNAVAVYKNGNTTAFDSGADVSDFVPRSPIYFFGFNSGGLSTPTASQMSAGFIGKGLSSGDMALLAGRINDYMNTYSIAVY